MVSPWRTTVFLSLHLVFSLEEEQFPNSKLTCGIGFLLLSWCLNRQAQDDLFIALIGQLGTALSAHGDRHFDAANDVSHAHSFPSLLALSAAGGPHPPL